jgi:hypothetical protein
MIRPAILLSTMIIAPLGCGGRANGSTVSTDSGSSSGLSIGSGSDAASDGGLGDIVDAETPDAIPVTCAAFSFVLEPDAAANMCAFTPADVECNSNADCTTYVKNDGCGCFDPIYGVNTKNTVRCYAPPCGVQLNPDGGIYMCPADASGLYTQDCEFVPDSLSVAVACVSHQCLTYAATPGSE